MQDIDIYYFIAESPPKKTSKKKKAKEEAPPAAVTMTTKKKTDAPAEKTVPSTSIILFEEVRMSMLLLWNGYCGMLDGGADRIAFKSNCCKISDVIGLSPWWGVQTFVVSHGACLNVRHYLSS